MIPLKIEKWLSSSVFPQRVMLSGMGDNIAIALEIAARLQGVDQEMISKGLHADTTIFRDKGKSFKIDFSEAAKRDEQGEFENVRGLIRWAHQKPTANHRIAILENFERISRDAPHALLKLIEEPPAKTIFLFTTQNHHQILQTILSRVTVVPLATPETPIVSEKAHEFLAQKTRAAQFSWIEAFIKHTREDHNRAAAVTLIENLMQQDRMQAGKNLNTLWETHQALKANVNQRFALERMALKFI